VELGVELGIYAFTAAVLGASATFVRRSRRMSLVVRKFRRAFALKATRSGRNLHVLDPHRGTDLPADRHSREKLGGPREPNATSEVKRLVTVLMVMDGYLDDGRVGDASTPPTTGPRRIL